MTTAARRRRNPQPATRLAPAKRVNLRTPEVMAAVQAQVENHYRSGLVEQVRARGGVISSGGLTVRLAKQFGFCYGVERAIDLAYAARKVFADRRVFILGEIIHNPEVNEQIRSMGIRNLIGPNREAELDDLTAEDVVLVPAFGAEVPIIETIQSIGCQIVDTTCGDVMSVWKRVRQYAAEQATQHHPRQGPARGNQGHRQPGVRQERHRPLPRRPHARRGGLRRRLHPPRRRPGGIPDEIRRRALPRLRPRNPPQGRRRRQPDDHVARGNGGGQRRIRQAIVDRDGPEMGANNFRFFDTICGATQERQDALRDLLELPMDLMLVVGGYNSSNTSHLAEMGQAKLPTYFIRNATRLETAARVTHFDLHLGREVTSEGWLPDREQVVVGVTAGASCPNHLIEETIKRLFELRGVNLAEVV